MSSGILAAPSASHRAPVGGPGCARKRRSTPPTYISSNARCRPLQLRAPPPISSPFRYISSGYPSCLFPLLSVYYIPLTSARFLLHLLRSTHPPAPFAPSLSPAPSTYHALCRTSQSMYLITHNRRHSKRGRPHYSMLRSSSSAAVPEAAIPPPHSLAKVMMLSFLRPQNSRGPRPHPGNPL